MGRGCDDKDNPVAGHQFSVAVDDQHVAQIPALAGLCLQPFELFLCHSGIVFQRHGRDGLVARVTRMADEAGEPADFGVSLGHPRDFRTDVEIFSLYPDRLSASGHRRKSATSSPSAMAVSRCDFLVDGGTYRPILKSVHIVSRDFSH